MLFLLYIRRGVSCHEQNHKKGENAFLVCIIRPDVLLKRLALIEVIKMAIIHQAVIEMTRDLSNSNDGWTVPCLIH